MTASSRQGRSSPMLRRISRHYRGHIITGACPAGGAAGLRPASTADGRRPQCRIVHGAFVTEAAAVRSDRGAATEDIPASRNVAAPYPRQSDHMPLRCILVDDSAAFLEAASLLLEREGVTVVGVASSIAEALRAARALRPDVILVDIRLGEESGFDLARLLARDGGGGAAVILT